MTYEDFHRWTVSKELERPDVADVMAEARRNIASLPRAVTGPGLSMAAYNQSRAMQNVLKSEPWQGISPGIGQFSQGPSQIREHWSLFGWWGRR